jgi:ribonuclease P/MRP protein subunit POP1
MGISSPFHCHFNQLFLETNGSEKFYVLRNKQTLKELNVSLKKCSNITMKLNENVLIPITLLMNQSGLLTDFSIVCLPKKRDVKNSLVLKYAGSSEPIHQEESIDDENEEMRKSMKFNHKKLLKRLRNRRVRLKRKLQATSNYLVRIPKSNNEEIIKKHYLAMCDLWLPEKPHSIRNQCSREVFGYVTSARFSLFRGKVNGIGYVTLKGLQELIKLFQKFKNLKPFVVARATHSKCYFTANIEVTC